MTFLSHKGGNNAAFDVIDNVCKAQTLRIREQEWDRHAHMAGISDIEALHHQVKVTPEIKDLLRLHWGSAGRGQRCVRAGRSI